jgi:hypothetical protein
MWKQTIGALLVQRAAFILVSATFILPLIVPLRGLLCVTRLFVQAMLVPSMWYNWYTEGHIATRGRG